MLAPTSMYLKSESLGVEEPQFFVGDGEFHLFGIKRFAIHIYGNFLIAEDLPIIACIIRK